VSKRGRPPKSRADKQSVRVIVCMTPGEKKQLDAEAKRAKMPVSTLMRSRALKG
jgi:hypothetical protein